MKKILLACVVTAFSLTGNAQTAVQSKFEKLNWLVGKWSRTNVKPGTTAGENWTKDTPGKLKGLGYTIKGTDTVFKEDMLLEIQGNEIAYVVLVTGSPQPVTFKLTEVSANGFVCENAANDFPKKITYEFANNEIKAVISGGGNPVQFLFKRQ